MTGQKRGRSEGLSDGETLCLRLADTLRATLMAIECVPPYPWEGGALKEQIRDDLAAAQRWELERR